MRVKSGYKSPKIYVIIALLCKMNVSIINRWLPLIYVASYLLSPGSGTRSCFSRNWKR